MYRCWGARQGDENRCNLRETVPGFECCLLGLSKEAGHSVTYTERVKGWQSKCIVLTKGKGDLMSWNIEQIGTSAKRYHWLDALLCLLLQLLHQSNSQFENVSVNGTDNDSDKA